MALNLGTVQVLDTDNNPLFLNSIMIRATVKEESRNMEHPIETGAIITDHRIILPVEVNLVVFIPVNFVNDTYSQIKQIYLDGTFITVQARTGTYSNQLISGMPHEESAEKAGVVVVGFRSKQAQIVKSQSTTTTVTPTDPANDTTVDRGTQQGSDTENSSAASSLTGIGR